MWLTQAADCRRHKGATNCELAIAMFLLLKVKEQLEGISATCKNTAMGLIHRGYVRAWKGACCYSASSSNDVLGCLSLPHVWQQLWEREQV